MVGSNGRFPNFWHLDECFFDRLDGLEMGQDASSF
jgi:hypothetical protein